MIRKNPALRWLQKLVLGSALLSMMLLFSCTDQQQATFLLHLKRPLSMVAANVNLQYCYVGTQPTTQFCFRDSECRSGETCKAGPARKVMFTASADLDAISMVDIPRRRFFLDPNILHSGIVYLKTGRMPVSLAVSPDQKQLFVLHGGDGNMMIYDLTTLKPVMDPKDSKKELRFPRDCAASKTCWSKPQKLKVFEANNKVFAFLLLDNDKKVRVINLTSKDADFGKVVQTIALDAVPSDVFLTQDGKAAYLTSQTLTPASKAGQPEDERKVVFKLDVTDLSKKPEVFVVGARTSTGTVLDDGETLYLVDIDRGGIRIYSTKDKKVLEQGDKRFPTVNVQLPTLASTTAEVPAGTFQTVKFVSYYQRNSDGSSYDLKKGVWANASDGYGYMIDISTRALIDSDPALPGTANVRLVIPSDPNTNQLGDDAYPRVEVDKIETFDGKTRSENWTLTYEGVVVEGSANVDTTKKTLVDVDGTSFANRVVVGDIAIFGEGCNIDTKKNDKGQLCVFAVTKVEDTALTLDLGNGNPPATQGAAYRVRAVQSYTVYGAASGLLPTRAKEETKYTSDFFALTILAGQSKTPRDARFEFSTVSGFSPQRVQMAGLPSQTLVTRDQIPCSKNDCKEDRCVKHPVCTGQPCVAGDSNAASLCTSDEVCNPKDGKCLARSRFWILDPARHRFLIVDPTEELKLERFLQ